MNCTIQGTCCRLASFPDSTPQLVYRAAFIHGAIKSWGVESGNVQYLDLNRWDGIRVRLGGRYGIVSGNVSGNTT